MSEAKLKRLTQRLKELREDYIKKKHDKETLEKTLKTDYKIKSIDEALKREKEISVEVDKLKKKRDSYINKAEELLDEYEDE